MKRVWTCFFMHEHGNEMPKHDQICWNHKITYQTKLDINAKKVNVRFAAPYLQNVLTSISFHDQKYHTEKGDIDAKKGEALTYMRSFNHNSA